MGDCDGCKHKYQVVKPHSPNTVLNFTSNMKKEGNDNDEQRNDENDELAKDDSLLLPNF